MWKFSLREIILVTSLFGLAMAVNVWNHCDLRAQLAGTQTYARDVEQYAGSLRRELYLAQQEAVARDGQISRWLTSGKNYAGLEFGLLLWLLSPIARLARAANSAAEEIFEIAGLVPAPTLSPEYRGEEVRKSYGSSRR